MGPIFFWLLPKVKNFITVGKKLGIAFNGNVVMARVYLNVLSEMFNQSFEVIEESQLSMVVKST